VSNSTLSNNSSVYVGGLDNNGKATVSNTTFSGNSATYSAGGIVNNVGGTLTLMNSTLTGNSAFYVGGILNGGTLTVTNSTLAYNSASSSSQASGINNESPSGMLTMLNTIVARNTGPAPEILGTYLFSVISGPTLWSLRWCRGPASPSLR